MSSVKNRMTISGQAEVVSKRSHICPEINTHWASFPLRQQLVRKLREDGTTRTFLRLHSSPQMAASCFSLSVSNRTCVI